MEQKVSALMASAKDKLHGPINKLEKDLSKIRAGKASPVMLESVRVDYYGNMVPISQVASINTPDAKTILVQPWEKKVIEMIEKAILAANLGFTPMNDGIMIRISLPPVTEERRRDLVKQVKVEAEACRVAVRNIRRDVNEELKKLKKDGMGEDLFKNTETEIQKLTDNYVKKIDDIAKQKEDEIMKV